MDKDIEQMPVDKLQEEIMLLRTAIRNHRDQKDDNNCYLDDFTYLYSYLPEKIKADPQLPNKQLMMTNCTRYYECRKNNKLYVPLEKISRSPKFAVEWLKINEYTPPFDWPIVVFNINTLDMCVTSNDSPDLIEINCSFEITHWFPLPKVPQ